MHPRPERAVCRHDEHRQRGPRRAEADRERRRRPRLRDVDGDGLYEEREVVVPNLPIGHHRTRTIQMDPARNKFFLSIGSKRRTKNIYRFSRNGIVSTSFVFLS